MRSANRRKILFTVILLLMAFSLSFAAPSGAILPDAAARYQENSNTDWSRRDAWDYTLGSIPVRQLASAGLTDVILPVNSVSYLPLDGEAPGRVPIEENFTATGYSDETIIVEVDSVRAYDSTFHVAYVKVATPTQLRTAVAGGLGSGRTLKPTVFSQSMNAVVLMNGDYYSKTDGGNGYIVRQGEKHRWKPSNRTDLLLIDENSDFPHHTPR